MKIQIETRAPDAVQEFFSAPLTFAQKVTVKKLLIVERILERMKALGLNRSQLAAKMAVSPARITTMMDGTNNFTIETLMRAADAVDAELELAVVPRDQSSSVPETRNCHPPTREQIPPKVSSAITRASRKTTASL
jgi:transcriptional regulator with XRE-family HTH domain